MNWSTKSIQGGNANKKQKFHWEECTVWESWIHRWVLPSPMTHNIYFPIRKAPSSRWEQFTDVLSLIEAYILFLTKTASDSNLVGRLWDTTTNTTVIKMESFRSTFLSSCYWIGKSIFVQREWERSSLSITLSLWQSYNFLGVIWLRIEILGSVKLALTEEYWRLVIYTNFSDPWDGTFNVLCHFVL